MMSKHRMRTVLMVVIVTGSLLLAGCNQQTANNDSSKNEEAAIGAETGAENEAAENQPTTATWTLAEGWQMPVSVPSNYKQDDWYDMGWETFIALNWPAKWTSWPKTGAPGGSGGQPDENASITTARTPYTAVWQTYLAPEQVFLDKGADPGSWTAPNIQLATKVDATGKTLPVLGGFSKGVASPGEKEGEINEATDNPLIAQDGNFVSFEMRMNQSEFTYLTHYKYYDAFNQQKATAKGGTIQPIPKTGTESYLDLPEWAQQGATEIKASWRIISNDQFADRYFTMQAFRELPDGTVDGPHLFGLVGLHILRLTPNSGSTWFWATFEQVDNVQIDESPIPAGLTPSFNPGTAPPYPTYAQGFEYNGAPTPPPTVKTGLPLPALNPVNTSRIANAIQSGAVASNKKYHAMLPDTVWQYYQMIGVLNPGVSGSQYTVPPFNNPTNGDQLANTTMETYSQIGDSKPISCFTCHAGAYPVGAELDKNRYPAGPGNQIFTFLFDDAQPSQ